MRRAALLWGLAAGLLPGPGQPPWYLIHEPSFTFRISLTQASPAGQGGLVEESLSGKPGERVRFSRDLDTAAGKIRTVLFLTPELNETLEICRLLVEAETAQAGRPPSRIERRLEMGSGRSVLIDLWTDPEVQVRLVAGVGVEWEMVPRITELLPGARALDITIEVVRGEGVEEEVVERHHLGGVLGSPVAYLVRTEGGKVLSPKGEATSETETPGRLFLEILPRAIENGLLALEVKLRQTGKTPYSAVEKLDVGLSDRLTPGGTLVLPLPRQPGRQPLAFRVIPDF